MTERKKQIEKLLENIRVLKRKIFLGAISDLKNNHITASQWFVFQYLYKNEGITVKEVAKSLNMTSSAVTQLVEALVKNGYIIKKINNTDRRELKLTLSSKSKRHIKDMKNKRFQTMENIFSALTDNEFKSYCRLYNKIVEGLADEDKPAA